MSHPSNVPDAEQIISSVLARCSNVKTRSQRQKIVVNGPFSHKLFATTMDLGIVVLLEVNHNDGMIDRVALSDTELALGAVKASAKPFHAIRIPLNYPENAIATAIATGKVQITEDWACMFVPALTDVEARRNQQSASIECSIIVPFSSGNGAMIFSFFQPLTHLNETHKAFVKQYAHAAEHALGFRD